MFTTSVPASGLFPGDRVAFLDSVAVVHSIESTGPATVIRFETEDGKAAWTERNPVFQTYELLPQFEDEVCFCGPCGGVV